MLFRSPYFDLIDLFNPLEFIMMLKGRPCLPCLFVHTNWLHCTTVYEKILKINVQCFVIHIIILCAMLACALKQCAYTILHSTMNAEAVVLACSHFFKAQTGAGDMM